MEIGKMHQTIEVSQ